MHKKTNFYQLSIKKKTPSAEASSDFKNTKNIKAASENPADKKSSSPLETLFNLSNIFKKSPKTPTSVKSPEARPIIALVEDNVINQKVMQRTLNKLFPEYKVVIFSTGDSALEYLTFNKVNLIILDGNLDGTPGLSIIKQLFNTDSSIMHGPDVARVLLERGISTPMVMWTTDPAKMNEFDTVFKRRIPMLSKPCNATNIEQVLTPLLNFAHTENNCASPSHS